MAAGEAPSARLTHRKYRLTRTASVTGGAGYNKNKGAAMQPLFHCGV